MKMQNEQSPQGQDRFKERRAVSAFGAGIAAIAITLVAAPAAAQESCSTYRVAPGDTLSQIAARAGTRGGFRTLFDANRNVISNPNLIEVGDVLRIPCADGSLPVTEASATPAPAPVLTSDEPIEIRLVTASGYAPFTDEGMEGGGIYTQLVRAAMDTMEPNVETRISFVNDWGSHLDALLPAVAFDGAFPWLVPNCAEPETLTENSQFRCNDFIHSNPFYEIINGLTVPASSPLATTTNASDFEGLRVCLPESYTDATLAQLGLAEPNVVLVRPVDPDDCLRQLVAGELDAISLELRQMEDMLSRLGHEGDYVANPNLTVTSTLSVFISKNHPDGPEVIALLNQGLANIQESGVWFNTVREGFRTFYEG